MNEPLSIVVVSDPVCPWCLLGLQRLERALARYKGDREIKLSYWPFLLDPSLPKEGVEVYATLTEKYGRPPDEMWDRLEREAEASGMTLDMRAVTRRYPSQPALAVVAAARRQGVDYALGNAIGRAYYLEGRNIAEPEVLADLGAEHGLDREVVLSAAQDETLLRQVEAEAREIAQQGVTGVPMFLFDNRVALSGAQPEHVLERVLEDLSTQN